MEEFYALLTAADSLANSKNAQIARAWERNRPMLYLAGDTGTLDPFIAFALSQGLAGTRQEAGELRVQFDEWLDGNQEGVGAEERIDPQFFLQWERSLPRHEHVAERENTVTAELDGTTGEKGLYRVIPVQSDDFVVWIDAAGFSLARSLSDASPFRGRIYQDDFELHTDLAQPFVDRSFSGART